MISNIFVWADALASAIRFYGNKILYAHMGLKPDTSGDGDVKSNGVWHARASVGQSSGDLPYCLARDARGIMHGVQPSWMYLSDFGAVGPHKAGIIRRLLSQLPGDVSFHFAFQIDIPDAAVVRRTFARAGFKVEDYHTLTYSPPAADVDLIDSLTGKSIKGTLRRAKRDLELFDISARDYFRFQRANLAASDKKNNRNDNLDRLILEEALLRKKARIIGARRKIAQGDQHPHPHPLDAAAVCLWDDSARVLILWRLTYREHVLGPLVPHVDATKLLILAAMQEAADRGMILDTDGYTRGIKKCYELFGPGVFRLASRLHCDRESLWMTIHRYYPSVGRWLGAIILKQNKAIQKVQAVAPAELSPQ